MAYSTRGEMWMRPHVCRWLQERCDHVRVEYWRVDMCGFKFKPRVKREQRVAIDSIAVELKQHRVNEAIVQAINNFPSFHQSYVCFPEDRYNRMHYKPDSPCRATGVGLLVVSAAGEVKELIPSNANQAQLYGGYLSDWNDRWELSIHRSWLRTRNQEIAFEAGVQIK
jgi:hypothetical protein